MPDPFVLRDWQSFYLLAGTASATLIGLMFVAISFGARLVPTQSESSVRAFVTPTVIHFSAVLVLSIFALIPTFSNEGWAIGLALLGAAGLAYGLGVIRQMLLHRGQGQPLDAGHWIWHMLLPMAGYVLIFVAGLGPFLGWPRLPNAPAFAAIALIVTVLRNAFDLMMWIAHQSP